MDVSLDPKIQSVYFINKIKYKYKTKTTRAVNDPFCSLLSEIGKHNMTWQE